MAFRSKAWLSPTFFDQYSGKSDAKWEHSLILKTNQSAFGDYTPTGFLARLLKATRAASPSWSGKRKASFLRSLGMKILRGKPVDVTALGARMRLYPDENLCEKRLLFTPQYFDPAERAFLATRIKPDFIFIDIGANIGVYALSVAALVGPGARILAIEPQPEIHERLVFNVRQNAFATIKTLDCAVADREGDVILFINAGNRGETSMRIMPSRDSARIIVRARTLASIVADEGFGRIDAMKLDCEGAEDLILKPFFHDVSRALWPKTLIFEYMPKRWSLDLPAIVAGLGYCEALRTRQNLIFELPAQEARP